MNRILFLLLITMASPGRGAEAPREARFPLGEVPAGWAYSSLDELRRGLQELPFEVVGVLERPIGQARVSVYVALVPVQKNSRRHPASLWKWVEGTFVPSGLTPAKSFEMSLQTGVGPGRKWTFRESRVSRSGVGMNVAAFRTTQKYHEVFLILREQDSEYRRYLSQIKDLVTDLKIP